VVRGAAGPHHPDAAAIRRLRAERGDPGGLRFHVAVVLGVFVPYALGHYAIAHWCGVPPSVSGFRRSLRRRVFDQLLIIGLSEEVFFRGYLQTQFDRVWGRPYRCLGAAWGVGLPLAAALFAACHMWSGGPPRLIVFFPACCTAG